MAPIITALQSVYTALGGNAATVAEMNTTPELIAAIATQLSDYQGGELPTVTASDNGEVLTVVDGAWAGAALPAELPAVNADDNGKVLKVVNGAWAAADA